MASPELIFRYTTMVEQAFDAIDRNKTLQSLLHCDSFFKTDIFMSYEVYATHYLPLYPFIFERLPAFFFASENATIQYHLYTRKASAVLAIEAVPKIKTRIPGMQSACYNVSITSTMCLPSYSIFGIAKSGTSALQWYLQHHPQISNVLPKELCYYKNPAQYISRISTMQLCPDCIFGDSCISLVHAANEDHQRYSSVFDTSTIMLLLIRNTLSRAYAAYWYWCTAEELAMPGVAEYCLTHDGWNPRQTVEIKIDNISSNYTFERSGSDYHERCTSRGLCVEITSFSTLKLVETAHAMYGSDRLMVLSSEELYENTSTLLARIANRLELRAFDFSVVGSLAVNVNGFPGAEVAVSKTTGQYDALLPQTLVWATPYLQHECKLLERFIANLCRRWLINEIQLVNA
jgi:hypothetical protein